MRSMLIKKRNITIVSVLLIVAVLFSCMFPLFGSQLDLLPSLSANAADASTGVKIKRYASLDAFKKDYPKDADEFEAELIDGVDYSAFQVVVSQETSGENFAIFFDAKQYPETMVTDTMFSNFGTQYCKYLNTLKAITGKSHGVMNVYLRMLYEGGFPPGYWDGTAVNTNADFTDGLMTAIMQCTATDFYTNWCLFHETSHAYGESYFNIHSETSVNLRSFAAIHAMGNGKTETDPHFHFVIDYDPNNDSNKDKFPAATVPNKFYSSEVYMDSFIANTMTGVNATFFGYKSLDEVDPINISDIIYGNCSTLDVAYLSANTKTNLFKYSQESNYKEMIYNTLTGSTCKIDWDRFYAQFIVNPENIKDSFMSGALQIYNQFSSIYSLEKIPTCTSVLNTADNTITSVWDRLYVTEETKKFLDKKGYLCSDGLYKGSYTVSNLLVRFYESLYMVSGSYSLDLFDNVRSDFTFTQFIDQLLNEKYCNYGTAPARCSNHYPTTTILFGGQTITISADDGWHPPMGRLVDGKEVLSGTVQWQNYTTKTNIDKANSIVCDITPPVGLSEYEMLTRTINETGSEYSTGYRGHHYVYAFSQPTLVVGNETTLDCLSVVAGFENASSIDFAAKKITFQWQEKTGSTWSDISDKTSPTLNLNATNTVRTYRCIITGLDQQIISDAVTVYTVLFDSNGGATPSILSRAVTHNSTYGTLPTPTRTGYTFAGWYTAATGGTKVTADSKYTTAACSTLYAHWTAKAVKVTFHRNTSSSDTVTGAETFTYDVENQKFGFKPDGTARYSTMQTESKGFGTWTNTGYSMLGWSIDKNATDKTYNTYSSVTNSWIDSNSPSIDLYAVWKANSYTVTFNANSGTCSEKSKSVTYNSTYGELPTPTRTGYTFAGWYTAETDGTAVTLNSKYTTADDLTLYAHWKENNNTVTGNGNGDANDDGKVNVADAVAVLQYIANKAKYPLTDKEQENADCDGVPGITGHDAITIQKVDAGILVLE